MSLRLAESSSHSDLHSIWLGVLLHFDGDFFHRLRYNNACVERREAIVPVSRTRVFDCIRKGFTSFGRQRVVWQGHIAIRHDSKKVTLLTPLLILAVAVRSKNTPTLFFFFFFFLILPQNLRGRRTSNKEFTLCGLKKYIYLHTNTEKTSHVHFISRSFKDPKLSWSSGD